MNKFILYVLFPFLSSISLAQKSADLDSQIRDSKKMVKSGHDFYRSLVCPDGTTPEFDGVGTRYGSKGEFIDVYRIHCKDGTQGTFEWIEGQASAPPAPQGFRLKTESELRELRINGRVNELSISPGGPIWLTTMTGYSYLTEKFDEKWKKGTLIANKEEYANEIERINFFNDKVAIATGGLNGRIYSTEDGGLTWKDSKSIFSQFVYTAFIISEGTAWLGGSSGIIVQSDDFGRNWRRLKSSFRFDHRAASIFMADEKNGIAGSLDGNELLTTKDDWQSKKSIPTPKSQGLVPNGVRDTIKKVAEFNGEYVIKQSGLVFRSAKGNVKWRVLSVPMIVDFEIDKESKNIYFIDIKGAVYSSADLDNLAKVSAEQIHGKVLDSKVVHGYLYVLDTDRVIYEIGNSRFKKSAPYPN